MQHSAARFVKNDYRRNTNPADLITALGWPTLERRRIIKQATTFYKILNNIIDITPPPPPSRPTNLISNPWTIHSPQVSYKCNGLFILSQSHSHMEYDSTKNYQHKKPKIISRSYYGTPFHHTSSPKLPLNSKVFEHIMLRYLKSSTAGLLDPHQFGYQTNRSVDDA